MAKSARRAVAVAVLALAVVGGLTACEQQPVAAPAAGPVRTDIGAATALPPPPGEKPPVTQAAQQITFPRTGSGQWMFTAGSDEVAGTQGKLMRYRIALETDIDGVGPVAFAKDIRGILGDPRGWTGGGEWRLQQVGPDDDADFTIYLATPASRDKPCAAPRTATPPAATAATSCSTSPAGPTPCRTTVPRSRSTASTWSPTRPGTGSATATSCARAPAGRRR